jgi:flagellar protein FliL
MSEENEGTAEAAPQAKPAGGGGSKLLLLLVVANLAVTGLVLMKVGKVAAAKPAATATHAGPVVALETFIVNLNEPGQSRYLKTTMELEVANADAAKELNANRRAVRDEILRFLSGMTVNDTLGEQNKARMQADLVGRIDRLLGGGRVRRIFFTEFVVQ